MEGLFIECPGKMSQLNYGQIQQYTTNTAKGIQLEQDLNPANTNASQFVVDTPTDVEKCNCSQELVNYTLLQQTHSCNHIFSWENAVHFLQLNILQTYHLIAYWIIAYIG